MLGVPDTFQGDPVAAPEPARGAAAVRRLAEPVASWVALGLMIGFIGPTAAIVAFELPALEYLPFVVGSTLVGLGGGLALGVLDPPGRLVHSELRSSNLAVRGGAAFVAAAGLGALWSAVAGATGGLAFWVALDLLQGGLPFVLPITLVVWGALLGLVVGGPVVALFALARVVGAALGVPGRVSLAAAVTAPLLGAVLARVAFAMLFAGFLP